MKKLYISLLMNALLLMGGTASGQEVSQVELQDSKPASKAWEIGVGGSVFQFSRVQFSNFTALKEQGYVYDLTLKHAVYGGQLYLARELSPYFYLDLQGTAGMTTERDGGKEKTKSLFMLGPGLQWRLGEYFGSKYIDPYLRVGVNYMYKGFNIDYVGFEGLGDERMEWILSNENNKDGMDRKHLTPVAAGGGVNMWFNDRLGIGFQADYLVMPYKNVPNSLQGSARLIWRLGGKSKKSYPAAQYVSVDKVVEKVVEKPVEVERIVERVEYTNLHELFNNIYFDFNKATLTAGSEQVIDEISEIMKQDSSKKYLITGYTDAKGSPAYNLELSVRRAETVVNALVSRGVSPAMLKSVGVGKKISHIPPSAEEKVREGDRKVTIELITNQLYWDSL